MNQLANISKARKALAAATDMSEVLEIRDKAEAIRVYLKTSGESLEAMNQAAEIKLRADRRLGEMLSERPVAKNQNSAPDTTLGAIGVSYAQSSRWKKASSVPEKQFESFLTETREAKKEITSAALLKLAARQSTNGKTTKGIALNLDSGKTVTALEDISGEKFGTIYADPPWRYGNQSTRASTDNHYDTMSVDELCEMPIAELAADDSHLHLWTTNAFLFDAKRVIESWGFEYRSCFVWVKTQMGIGNYWRVSHEFMLLGIRGDSKRFADKSLKSWFESDRGKHSAKPEEVRRMVEKASPGPYLELFGRKPIDGWTVFGNQIERMLFGNGNVSK